MNRDNRSALGALDRRALLRSGLGAVGLASVGVPLLDACGSSASGGGTTKSGGAAGGGGAPAAAAGGAVNDYGPLAYRLPGVENVEFAGVYVADNKGYYKAEGFSSLSLFPGGPAASSVEGDVVSKKADLAVGSLDVVAAAIVQGAPLKIVGAQYQKNPFAITSMADKAINAPEDMYGKKIGVQAADEAVWNGFLAAAKLDASKITKVAVQADPTPLTQGAVDGWFSLCTDEPVALGTKGFKVATMMLADHGYPMVSQVYILHTDSIAQSRGTIKSFLRGEIKGWTASLVDPGLGASLAAGSYGKSLGLAVDEQTSQSKAQNKLILTADTKANGLFTVTDALVAQSVATLKASGLDITADKLFDLSMLKEVYQEDPALVSALPAVPAA